MVPYPYDSISLNGRKIEIRDILARKTHPNSDFELHALDFIYAWLTGVNHFVVNTSGSTGNPKEITISRDQMISSAKATAQAIQLKAGYRALIALDARFIAGKMMIVRCFVSEMLMEFVEPKRNPFIAIDNFSPVDFAALVPHQVEEILESPQVHYFNSIKVIIIGGAPLNPTTAKRLENFPCRFYLTYGMTETISHIALQLIEPGATEGTYKVLPGIEIDTDPRGCLIIHAPYLPGKVITNDLVQPTLSGEFRWLGRWDNVINTSGVKVQPEKIESQIEIIFKSLNIQKRFFIAGLPDVKTGKEVALFIEGKLEDPIEQEIRNRLKVSLERFERPKRVVFMDEFYTTKTNKIDRSGTIKKYEEQQNY